MGWNHCRSCYRVSINHTFSIIGGQVQHIYCINLVRSIGRRAHQLGGFMRAGAALTRSDNHWLNLAVGLGIPVILLIIFAALITFLQR